MGEINRLLGNYAEAEEAYEQATRLGRQLVQRDANDPGPRQALANSYNWLGEVRRHTSRYDEANRCYDHALEIQSRLIAEHPDRPEYVREKARSLNNRGIILRSTGDFESARRTYEEAISLLKPLARAGRPDPSFAHELARIRINLGNLLGGSENQQDRTLARDAYSKAIESLNELAAAHPRAPVYRFELANAVINLGNLLRGAGSPREARELFTHAVGTLTRLQEDYPGRLSYQSELANAYNSLAVIEVREDAELAGRHWEEASKRFERLTELAPEDVSFHYRAGLARYNLGLLAERNKQDAPALEHFEQSLPYLLHAVSKNAENVQYQQQARRTTTRIINRRLERGEDVKAAETIRKYAAAFAHSDGDLLEAARLMAGCASAASGDADPQPGKPAAERAREYVAEALGLLGRIAPDRLSPTPSLRDDPSFAALSDNKEFQAILARWPSPGTPPKDR
jgi:tetratricopeptide (TPR) repeat protein